ncbi:conserved Plasmodium protein, unknown function [Plasmodium relictum]|uniref:Translational activator GCN1 n=1 Tax=Plasmodium relictum TaxID=85471 RepID=A0A1J1HB59_PLARL|nr:conserved Plasmodium protein, unknown function [Plasmodium relictum]CRH02301.1 conserved Plasmodium protein, unknown function [Plasmodium relictum]
MLSEKNNIDNIFEFLYSKKKINENIQLLKNDIEDILKDGNNEQIVPRFINLVLFVKDEKYLKNNLSICLYIFSKSLSEINNINLKKNIFKYILKKLDNRSISYFDRALVCKRFFYICTFYDTLTELKNNTTFSDLFVNCLAFLDSLFYSNKKYNELSNKFRNIKKCIIHKLIIFFNNIFKMNKGIHENEYKNKLNEDFEFILNKFTKDNFFYIFVESFSLFMYSSNNNLLNREEYMETFVNCFSNHLNSSEEISLKINKSFKFFFRNLKDEKIFSIILKQIHRFDEAALTNSTPFYYYSELYNKDHFYDLLEIVINVKKKKNIENSNLLFLIILHKFHINNDHDSILKILFENNKKLNIIKFNEKVIFLRSIKYLLSTNKNKELKDIVISNKNIIINYLKNDLNEDVKLESLDFIKNVCSIFKNDKDIYNAFSSNVFEILEKFGKNNEKFLYFCILFYLHSISVIEVNEKMLTAFKSHLNLCLTKQILKYTYGVNLLLFLVIKNKFPSINVNNYINEILFKSIYNQNELFYLFDMNEIKKIPYDKFFFYMYSLCLLLHFIYIENKKIIPEYTNSINNDFLKYISLDHIEKEKVQILLNTNDNKSNKNINISQVNKKEDKKIEKDVQKININHLNMLCTLIILCMLHYLQEKNNKIELKKKKRKNCGNYILSLKKCVSNENNYEYQNFLDDFDMLLDILLMKKDIYQLILCNLYNYLFIYWNNSLLQNTNYYILRKFLFFLFSYVTKIDFDNNERENCYTLLLLCLCHPQIFYKNLTNPKSRKKIKKFISNKILNNVNFEIIINFVLKGYDYYNNDLHKNLCFNLVEIFYILEKKDSFTSKEENILDRNKRDISTYDNKNDVEMPESTGKNGLFTIKNLEIKEKLIFLTSKLIDMLDDKSIENIKDEEIEICKCPYDFLYVDKNVYQPTVVIESKNLKRNKHLVSTYGEETAELIMEEQLNKNRKANTNQTKEKKCNKNKGMTKEELEKEEIKKQNEIRINIYEKIERNKYLLKCIKKMSYINDVYDTKYINLLIKKIMIFLKNDLTSRYSQKYLNIIIDNMISTELLKCKNKITRCLYKISKYNKADETALMIFSSFNMNEKISYVLTLFLFPIVFHSINIINDKNITLNILKTLDILLHSKTKINDEDALKCLQISFSKYPDLDIELESFLNNFNSYLLNKKNIKTLLEFCITENEKRRNVIIKSLHKYIKNKEKEDVEMEIFKNELIYNYINIYKNDYNKETKHYCKEIISILKIPCVSDQYKLIDSLQKECLDFQNMVCKAIVGCTEKKNTKQLIIQLTSKYITFKEYGKIGILKTLEHLSKAYYITSIDDVEFILNFLLGLCLEEKNDIDKIKDYVIICGSSLINSYNEYISKFKKKKEQKRNINKNKKDIGKEKMLNNNDELSDYSNLGESFDYSSSSSSAIDNVTKIENEKEMRESFKRIYNVLNKYRDNKKSKHKNTLDLIVVMFYGCLGSNLKNESLELLNKLIEQILHKETDNFTQIEISIIIPKFIENLKNDKESDDDYNDIKEGTLNEEYNNFNSNNNKNGIHESHIRNEDIVNNIKGKNKNSKNNKLSNNDEVNGSIQAIKNKKKLKNEKENTNSLIYLETYDINILLDKLFYIIFNNKELKIRKGSCLLLGSAIKAHGMNLLKKHKILEKVNSNIHSEDVIKRQSFYLTYGSLFKVLKYKFEPYILKNFKLLLECYKDNVNNIKVLGISIIEEILNDISQYGMKKILPFIILNLKNSSTKNKDIISYLDTLHLIISKFDFINYIDNYTLVDLINLLCELVAETNTKVKEICIKIFNKLEKMIPNNEMKNISRQLLLCIYSPNDVHLNDFLDIFSSISFEFKIDNISLCLLFPIIKKGINNIRLEIKKKSLQIFYFLIYLVQDQSLFIIYYNNIFETLIVLLNDAIPDIRYLTAKSIGNISQFLDKNQKLFYIQFIFNILINTFSSVEKSGVALCLSSILSKCSENIANTFISKIIRLIDIKKYIEIRNKQTKKKKKNKDYITKFENKNDKENKKNKNSKKKKQCNKKQVKQIEYSEEEYTEELEYEDEEEEEEGEEEGEEEEGEEEDYDDEDNLEEVYSGDDEDDADEDENEEDNDEDNEEEYDFEVDDDDYDIYDDEDNEVKETYYKDDDDDDDDEDEEEYYEEYNDGESESDSSLCKNNEKKYDYLNGYYLIKKNENDEYLINIDDDLINWKLRYDKKIIKNGNAKEGLIGFFIYMPECEQNYTEKFLKNILQKLMLCLNDTNEKIRDISLRACKVLISIYSRNNTSLILKNIENKIYNGYWRLRKDCVILLNILIEKNLEINKEEKDIELLHILHERFYFMLSLICIMKNDKNMNVRQAAYNIYKNYVNKRILQEMWPILLKKITQNLSSKNNFKQVISALSLGDLVFKTDSSSLEFILDNMIKEFKTTKYISIRKGISLGFYEIFSKNKFDNLIVSHIHNIIYMIKELAYHKNTSDKIKMLCSLLRNIDTSILKNIISDIFNNVLTQSTTSMRDFSSKQIINFKSIKIFLNVHTDLVLDFILANVFKPPYNVAKLKLLSYISYAKLSTYKNLFTKILKIFINLILYNSIHLSDGYDIKNYSAIISNYKEENEYDKKSTISNENIKNGINEEFNKEEEKNNTYEYFYKTQIDLQDIARCLKDFLKYINEKNIDTFTEIIFAELKKYSSKIDLSYSTLCKCENDSKAEGINYVDLMKNYTIITDANKLKELKIYEYKEENGKIREIILSIFKYLLDIINDGDISLVTSENITSFHDNSTVDQNNNNSKRKKINKKINILNIYRITVYLNYLSNYTLIDLNKNVLDISSTIYVYLIELIKKLDNNYSYIDLFNSIINKYCTDNNLKEIPDDKYEIVGLNLNKRLFASFINMFTNVILLSTNSDIKIKAIDILRKLFVYTNTEVSNFFILKISGILIRILTNKYIEQAKYYIFSTFEVLIKKGSNYIKPLIPQLQTCIIKSLNNEKLKNQIIHILNIISEKKLSKVDLLINDLLNNINTQVNVQTSITILMILSNILNTADVNVKNILNKIINSIKTLFNHSNKEISFYSCKVYILLIFFHIQNKKQYLESILTLKSTLDINTYHFMLHISEINNFYDILKKENLLDTFKQLYIHMLKDEINSLQIICYQIFYNLSRYDDDCLLFIYNIINYLKLPPLIMISIELHRYYFKGLKNIFKKKANIYKENIPNFFIIIDNIFLALFNTLPVFKLLGESCIKYVLEIFDENQYKTKIDLLKEKMETKKYNQLLEYVSRVLIKKRNTTSESE